MALTWFSRHWGTSVGFSPPSPQHRVLPPLSTLPAPANHHRCIPSCIGRISGGLLSFNLFTPLFLRLGWKVKLAAVKWAITHVPPPHPFPHPPPFVTFSPLSRSSYIYHNSALFTILSSLLTLQPQPPLSIPAHQNKVQFKMDHRSLPPVPINSSQRKARQTERGQGPGREWEVEKGNKSPDNIDLMRQNFKRRPKRGRPGGGSNDGLNRAGKLLGCGAMQNGRTGHGKCGAGERRRWEPLRK